MIRQPASRAEESGAAALAFVVAATLALVVFVTLADLVTMQFTRNAIRAATDEAVRVGSRADAPVAACETRARAVLDGLLGPGARDDVSVACEITGSTVHARADATLTPWLPGLPAWPLTVRSDAVQEALP